MIYVDATKQHDGKTLKKFLGILRIFENAELMLRSAEKQ